MEDMDGQNISKQEHINNIYQEYARPSRLLQSFTNLSNTVIQTALSGQTKFVFEILQNADDAFEDPNKEIEVTFILQDDYFIVQHNGKEFNYNDVERICDYASQIEEVKATDLSKTGYKGLGFKSLFNLSDTIYIHSNGYSFRFDKTYWTDWQKRPWQIIPIWCQYNELPLHTIFPYNQPVNIILKINDISQLEKQIRELIIQPDLLLFLHRIQKLSLNLDGETYNFERISESFGKFNRVSFYDGEELISTWLTKSYISTIPQTLKNLIQNVSHFIYPDKIKTAQEVQTTFAVPCNKDLKSISNTKGLLYSTLPTQLDITLPYHINSSFILNLDRSQLHENEWNEFLITQVGNLHLYLLRDIAGIDFIRNYVINVFRRKIDHPLEIFCQAYSKGFLEKSSEIRWLPSFQNTGLIRLNEAWIDETEFFKQNFKNINDSKISPYLIDYELMNQCLLSTKEDQVSRFSFIDLFDSFEKNYYPQFISTSYLDFISYIYKKLKDIHLKGDVIEHFKKVPFLISKNKNLVTIEKAIIEENENVIPDFLQMNDSVVDKNYLPLVNTDLIKDWFVLLGARKISAHEIIRMSILNWISSKTLHHHMNIKNHIEIIRYLSNNNVVLSLTEFEKLKDGLTLLTQTNAFKLAKNCYFPDAVSVKVFADIISKDEIIASAYNISDFKHLFIRLGVCEKLQNIDIVRRSILTWIRNNCLHNKMTSENYKQMIDYLAKEYPSFKKELMQNEKNELKKLLILTSDGTFQEAESCFFDSVLPEAKGLKDVIPKSKVIIEESLSETVREFFLKIGVSNKLEPAEVMRRTVLKWINENVMIKKVTKDNYKDILEYIADNWDSNYPSSKSLKSSFSSKEMNDIKRMVVLTSEKSFQEIRFCFFDSVVPGVKGFEEAFPKKNTIIKDTLSETVVKFLLNIGVPDKMEPVEVIRKTIFKWIDENVIAEKVNKYNYQHILKYIAENWDTTELSANLISSLNTKEIKDIKKMLILTSNDTFQEIGNCFFDSAIPNFKGIEDIFPKNVVIIKETISNNIVEFLLKIGVPHTLKPVGVLRNTLFKWINEDVIREKMTKDNYKNILQYIANNWNTTDHSNNGLKSLLYSEEMETIKKMLILASDETFQEIQLCYFDSAVPNVKGLEEAIPKHFVIIRDTFSENEIEFLLQLGVPEKIEPVDVISKTVLKWINENTISEKVTKDNYKDILQYIASNWEDTDNCSLGLESLLKNKDIQDLKKMVVLTKGEIFQKIPLCVFDSAVPNVKGLEEAIPKNNIIVKDSFSPTVINFFLKMGVTENIEPVKVVRKTVLKWIDENVIKDKITGENYKEILEYLASNWFSTNDSSNGVESLLNLSNMLKIKKMVVLTIDESFQEINYCYFDSAVPSVNGLEETIDKNKVIARDTFSENVIKFLSKIGVPEKMQPVDVIRKTVLKWIDEKVINEKVTKENYKDILEYIAENWSSKDHSTDIEFRLASSEKVAIKNMLVLTSDETFQEANLCYFDSAVPVVKGLEDAIPESNIIIRNTLSDSIVKILIEFGVKEKIKPVEVIRNTVITWITENTIKDKINQDNHKDILEYIANNFSKTDKSTMIKKFLLNEEEREKVKRMLVLTSDETFQEIQLCYFDSAVPKVEGLKDDFQKKFIISKNTYSETVNKFLLELGVIAKLEPVEVIRKTVLRWIDENSISEKVTKHNHKDILKYIACNWNNFNDSYSQNLKILLKPEEIKCLKKFPVLTKRNSFREAENCYLQFYISYDGLLEKVPNLDCIISDDELLSTEYEKNVSLLLLQSLGVQQPAFEIICSKYSDHLDNSENVVWFMSTLTKYWKRKKDHKNDSLLKHLKNKFSSQPCLSSKNEKKYRSEELYSSRFCSIYKMFPDIFPLLAYDDLPQDLEKWFGFKNTLDLECIVKLLTALNENTPLGQEETKTFFRTVLEELRPKKMLDIKKYPLSLFSKESKLKPAKELYYFKEEGDTCELKSCYLKRIHGMSHEETLELAELCGVNILPFDEQIILEKETLNDTLKEFYIERLPLIVAQEAIELNENPKETLGRLYNKISTIHLYQCQKIQLRYPFGDPVTTRLYWKNFNIYCSGKWTGKKTDIHEYLKKLLDIKTRITRIIDMENLSTDKEEWFEEHGEKGEKYFHEIEEELKNIINPKEDINVRTSILRNTSLVINEEETQSITHKVKEELTETVSDIFEETQSNIQKSDKNFKEIVTYADVDEAQSGIQKLQENLTKTASSNSDEIIQSSHKTHTILNEKFSHVGENKINLENHNLKDLTKVSSHINVNDAIPEVKYDLTLSETSPDSAESDEELTQQLSSYTYDTFQELNAQTNKNHVKSNRSDFIKDNEILPSPYTAENDLMPYDNFSNSYYETETIPNVAIPSVAKEQRQVLVYSNVTDANGYSRFLRNFDSSGCFNDKITRTKLKSKKRVYTLFEDHHMNSGQQIHYDSSFSSFNPPRHFINTKTIWVNNIYKNPLSYDLRLSKNTDENKFSNFGSSHFSESVKHDMNSVKITEYIDTEIIRHHRYSVDKAYKPLTLQEKSDKVSYDANREQRTYSEDANQMDALHLAQRERSLLNLIHGTSFDSFSNQGSYNDTMDSSVEVRETTYNNKPQIANYDSEIGRRGKAPNNSISQQLMVAKKTYKDSSRTVYQPHDRNDLTSTVTIAPHTAWCNQYDLQKLGEKCVFRFLQDHYKYKYPNSRCDLSDGCFTLSWESSVIEISWLNECEYKGLRYDLLLKKDGEVKCYIKVNSRYISLNKPLSTYLNELTESYCNVERHPDQKEKHCTYTIFFAEVKSYDQYNEMNIPYALYKTVILKNSLI